MDDITDLPGLTAGLLAAKTLVLALLVAVAVNLRQRTRRTLDQIARLETVLRAIREDVPGAAAPSVVGFNSLSAPSGMPRRRQAREGRVHR